MALIVGGKVIVVVSKSKLGRRTSIEDLRKAGFDIKVEAKDLWII